MRSHLLLAVLGTVAALPSSLNLPVRQVYDFPNPPGWLENLAVRSNGKILVTSLYAPLLYQFNPLAPISNATLIHNFTSLGTGSLIGITEISGHPDNFALIAGPDFTVGNFIPGGNFTFWRVDMSLPTPNITQIAQVPAGIPNGMASLDAAESAVLVSDTGLGEVWRLDLLTGRYTLAIDDPKMKSVQPNNTSIIGVNGIRILKNYLYFINADAPFLARIPIHANGTAAGASEIIGYSVSKDFVFDDFAVDEDGTAYVATSTGNVITQITPDGKATIIAGNLNSTAIADPTSVQFGRTAKDRRTLYATTNGGLGSPINGTVVIGPQLVAVELPW